MTTMTAQRVDAASHWDWLKAGWRDLWSAPLYSIGYGLIFVAVGLAITAGLWTLGLGSITPVALAGFALVAPAFAVGFYRISALEDAGQTVSWTSIRDIPKGRFGQVAFLGVLLVVIFLFWILIARALYATFTIGNYMPVQDFTQFALADPAGLTMIAVGTAIGGALAFAAFAISAFSFPMLIDRDVDAVTALIASVDAVKRMPILALSWAITIALMTAGGIALFILPLAIVFPWLGHASFRAYRDLFPS